MKSKKIILSIVVCLVIAVFVVPSSSSYLSEVTLSGEKADGLWVGDLGLGVEQRRQQGTHRHHHGRDGKQKRGLAYGHFRRYPPAQQPEGDQHDGGQERIAVQPEHGAERGAADAQQGDASGSDAGGAPGGAQLFP